jgi:hypothetical protein
MRGGGQRHAAASSFGREEPMVALLGSRQLSSRHDEDELSFFFFSFGEEVSTEELNKYSGASH